MLKSGTLAQAEFQTVDIVYTYVCYITFPKHIVCNSGTALIGDLFCNTFIFILYILLNMI